MDKNKHIKIITQVFYPDVVATGELLYDLAVKLKNKYGINVSVLTAQPNFTVKEKQKKHEEINGIKIERVSTTSFDKNSYLGKVLNSWIYCMKVFFSCLFSRKTDLYLIVTSPPLAPLIGAFMKIFKGQNYIYLMYDVYPEIAWKLGYIKKDGIICKIWQFLTDFSLIHAQKIIVLSDNMKNGILKRFSGVKEEKIIVIHNWANEEIVQVINYEENYLIEQLNLKDKFIVEYSGNIGRVHEFNTMLETAKLLENQEDVLFLIIGDGGLKTKVKTLADEYNLKNILFLPFQERTKLSYSLALASLHLLSVNEGYEELVAPSKLYGILASGKPAIFVGKKDYYITNMLVANNCGVNVEIGESEKLKNVILEFKNNPEKRKEFSTNSRKLFEKNYTLDIISEQYNEIFNASLV